MRAPGNRERNTAPAEPDQAAADGDTGDRCLLRPCCWHERVRSQEKKRDRGQYSAFVSPRAYRFPRNAWVHLGHKDATVVVSASRLVVLNVFAHKMRPSRFYERPLKYRWSMLMTIPGLLYAWPAEPRRFYGACRCRKKPQRFLARARRTTMLAQSGERKGRSDTSTWEACPICIRRRFPRLV